MLFGANLIKAKVTEITNEKNIPLADATACWDAALEAVEPAACVDKLVHVDGNVLRMGRTVVKIGERERVTVAAFGKASIGMARAFIGAAGDLVGGCVVAHPSNLYWTDPPGCVETIAAEHPLPGAGSLRAGNVIADTARSLGGDDILVLLISGGGSSLVCAPCHGISFDDKIETTRILLRSGVDINSLNCVRKHISAVKGGNLAVLASGARKIVSIMISDVGGDDPSVIASGPASPDETDYSQSLSICRGVEIPAKVLEFLERGRIGIEPETPKPGNPVFAKVDKIIAASNASAIKAALAEAARRGYAAHEITHTLSGEARDAGKILAGILKSAKPGTFMAAGGETTVTVTGNGKGGRCQELALAAAMELESERDCLIWAAGTDGIDGPTDAAGAWADGDTIRKASESGVVAADRLMNNDAYEFFNAVGSLIKTGPTGTNVMDIIFLLKR